MEKSRDDLILDNLNLVYHVIHTRYPTYRNDEDIIQTGMLALVKAADTYNEELGKFSTYAYRIIVNDIINEFVKRSKYKNDLSLNHVIGESDGDELTLSDITVGERDVNYTDRDILLSGTTERERAILDLLLKGNNQMAVARKLNVSRQAVNKVIVRLRNKWRKYL